jgi:hypothetical protein
VNNVGHVHLNTSVRHDVCTVRLDYRSISAQRAQPQLHRSLSRKWSEGTVEGARNKGLTGHYFGYCIHWPGLESAFLFYCSEISQGELQLTTLQPHSR